MMRNIKNVLREPENNAKKELGSAHAEIEGKPLVLPN